MAVSYSLSDWDAQEEILKSFVQDPKNWPKIPFINAMANHDLKDHQLVRFRGMIQHMYNPEFFMGRYEVEHKQSKKTETRSGRYRDVIQCSDDERLIENRNDNIEERQVFYCITTPALNDWVHQQEKELGTCDAASSSAKIQKTPPSLSSKRQAGEQEPMDVDQVMSMESNSSSVPESIPSGGPSAKRMSTDSARSSHSSAPSCPGLSLNFPIEGSVGMACMIKIYDADTLSCLKLNDVIDVVGFLSLDPSLAHASSAFATPAENLAENPPPSVVPRLHAVALQKLTHLNEIPSNIDEVFQTAENIRKELHLVLSQMLLGDTLAADYMICHLISLVYMRKDGLALGHFSMNLSNLPQRPDYTRLLYAVLQRILPKSHYLPMTLDNMNTLSMAPKMDYEANRLSSGLLQLSDSTHLVVDETRLEAGKLDVSGVANVQALRTLISHQIVNYDFQYYSKPYDADIPVLILSEGKSLLPCNILLPLRVDSACLTTLPEIFEAANHFLRDPLLSAIRLYLSVIRHSSFEFPEDLQKRAQEDFVEMRQAGGQTVSADDLHLLLVLARLISLSHGEKVVSLSSWDKAKKMERERKSRIHLEGSPSVQLSNEP